MALIKERLDLADLIGEYLPLRRFGAHWKGLCPFHQEKTPSFVVSPDKGIWHCFGCGEGGDAFTFVQRVEGLDFTGALKLLAERAGVPLPQPTGSAPAGDERQRLFELLAHAARFYHEILQRHSAGQQARAYLAERGVSPKTIAEFQIGYAPQQWQALQQFLQRKGFTTAEMVAAGAVGMSEQGKLFDRFRGRIMFPIHDVQGRVIAFGGRIVPWHATGSEGKYVNSPETTIYHKRQTIYNLHRAKQAIRQQQKAVVVEGYMDVVMLSQQGYHHVVASSGTAFTPEHVEQLKKFTPALHFAFDADTAGHQAALTATQAALAAGLRVATIVFPPGQDPADVALQAPAQLADYLEFPRSLISVLLQRLQTTTPAADREKVLDDLLPLVRQVTNIVQQGEMIQEIAQVLHVPEAVITQRLSKQPLAAPTPAAAVDHGTTALTAEQQLVGLLIVEPTLRGTLLADIEPALLREPAAHQLLLGLHELAQTTADFGELTPVALVEKIPDDQVPFAEAVRALAAAGRVISTATAEAEGRTLLRYLRRRDLEDRLRVLQQAVATAGDEQREAALREFQDVAQSLARLNT